jgi:hypothetical protein
MLKWNAQRHGTGSDADFREEPFSEHNSINEFFETIFVEPE